MNPTQNPRQRRAELHAKYLQLRSAEEINKEVVGQICGLIPALLRRAFNGGHSDQNSSFSNMANHLFAQLVAPRALRGCAEFLGEIICQKPQEVMTALNGEQWIMSLIQDEVSTCLAGLYHNEAGRFSQKGPAYFRRDVGVGMVTANSVKALEEEGDPLKCADITSRYPGLIFHGNAQNHFKDIVATLLRLHFDQKIEKYIGRIRLTLSLKSGRKLVAEFERPPYAERGLNPIGEAENFQRQLLSYLAELSSYSGVVIVRVRGGQVLDPEAVGRQFDPIGEISSTLDDLF